MIKSFKKHYKSLLFLLFSTIIFISRIWYIRESNVLAIRNDEYGYWTHAALFTGHDWSDVFTVPVFCSRKSKTGCCLSFRLWS